MSSSIRAILTCRLCGGGTLTPYIDFGDVPLGNNLQLTQEAACRADSFPLDLNRCGACGHFQLGHAVAPELLYATNYTYLSGIGSSFVDHFSKYAEWAIAKASLVENSLVVDVGSNDGTCLQAFQVRGATVCGVDPAPLAAEIANRNGIETHNTFFSAHAVAEIIRRHGHADFVTSHNVLAHVDDLAEVFRNIHVLLKDGGHFAFEIGYFRQVLSTGCFDTIYHEHLDYHHGGPLAKHLTALGFDLIEISVNNIQGGSLRLLLRKTGRGEIMPAAAAFLADEKQSVLYDEVFLAGWKQSIETQMAAFHRIVRQHVIKGATIVGYGAPTKATLLMKLAGLGGDDVECVVEDNVHKTGRFMPSTGVAIRSSSALYNLNPDVIVVFAWNFAEEIMKKLHGKFDRQVEFIVPLPLLRTLQL